MTTTTTTTRLIKDHAREGHFCDVCRVPATLSCVDARQVDGAWIESNPRYGCKAHPVQPMIYFENGTAMTAKEWEKDN